MANTAEFRDFVLDQLGGLGAFDTKAMFGGTALLSDGTAFAKIKHGGLWLKADDTNRDDFLAAGMPQYTYGKDNSRRLNFFQVPPEVLEDASVLHEWVEKAMSVASRSNR